MFLNNKLITHEWLRAIIKSLNDEIQRHFEFFTVNHKPYQSAITFRTKGFPLNQINLNIQMVRRRNVYITHTAHTTHNIYLIKKHCVSKIDAK